jgi:hypothetical protein
MEQENKYMPDENLEREKRMQEFYKMKADALDIHVLLDRLTTQGNQLADAYNKKIAEIEQKEKELNTTEVK